jgi:hypothetical protein
VVKIGKLGGWMDVKTVSMMVYSSEKLYQSTSDYE